MRKAFLEAGRIVSTHGVRGEMKVLPWADGPEFLTLVHRVFLDGKEYEAESVRGSGDQGPGGAVPEKPTPGEISHGP